MSVAEYLRLRTASLPDGLTKTAYSPVMHRQEAIQRIHAHRHELEALGAVHVTLFGSIARDEAMADSDVDVIVDSADGQALGLFKLGALKDQFERILGREVDVISRRGLNNTTKLKQRVAADLVDVY
jgi:predicted nucleotidyltransferase